MTSITRSWTRLTRRLRRAAMVFGIVVAAVVVLWGLIVWQHRDSRYDGMIRTAAARHGLDPFLVKAVIRQESRFNPNVRGKAGEVGLMQITEGAVTDWRRATNRSVVFPGGVFDPATNIEIGSWYLAKACKRWQHHPQSEVLALSQYNAGPARAVKWAELPEKKLLTAIPIPSTRSYITNVLTFRDEFSHNAQTARQ